MAYEWLPYAWRASGSAVFGVVVGIGVALLNDQSIPYTLVYSLSISIICWFCIDLGRRTVALWQHHHLGAAAASDARHWPGWPSMAIVLIVGSCLGFSAGTAIGDLVTSGRSANLFDTGDRHRAFSLLLLALAAAFALTYFFYTRGRIADREASLQLAQFQAAERKLKLLESQLEPHMLFNTLANLRVLIDLDPARAQLMLDGLIAFLRATLGASRTPLHPLHAEFARLGEYLSLIQVRMGERLTTHFELPEALADVSVPPLLLQPLVENSVKHGLETAISGGRIEVSAAREGDELCLRVRDTGVGLADVLGDDNSFGIKHVRERLETLYGSRASFSLSSVNDADGGALAIIRLPLAQK